MKNLKRFSVLAFITIVVFVISILVFADTVLAVSLVNINTAGVTELDTLPEIGPATAQKIIDYRLANGSFSVIEDIMKVSGIKEATFAKIRDYITVGSGSDDIEDEGDGGTSTTTATTTTPTTSSGGPVTYSVHYIQESLSSYEPTNVFKISAGRERLALLNIPILFEAKYTVSGDLQGSPCSYTWNFGDGVSVTGEKVEHIYKYVGDYNVVLNGKCRDLLAVSRTVVKVLEPDLAIKQNVDGSITVSNNGKYEVNLYGWKLGVSNTKNEFIFPQDTIISAGKSVVFPAGNLKLIGTSGQIVLSDISGNYLFSTGVNNLASGNSNQQITVQDLERFAVAYKSLVRSGVARAPTYVAVTSTSTITYATTGTVSGYSPKKINDISMIAAVAGAILTASSTDSYNEEQNQEVVAVGFWSKLFHPIRTIKESFYK